MDNDAYVRAVHDRGLAFDLGTLSRRRALGLFGAVGLVGLKGCTPTNPATAGATAPECVPEVPDETAGPFPGDGSNGANALTTSGVIRNDIRSSFGGPTGVAAAYATDGYARSVTNLSRISLGSDSVFRDDNGARQMATMTGNNSAGSPGPVEGWTAALTIAVN